jgi:hypothetical protein
MTVKPESPTRGYNFARIRYTAAPLTTALQRCQPYSLPLSYSSKQSSNASQTILHDGALKLSDTTKDETPTCASTCAGARARIAQNALKEVISNQ